MSAAQQAEIFLRTRDLAGLLTQAVTNGNVPVYLLEETCRKNSKISAAHVVELRRLADHLETFLAAREKWRGE
jgi:hypothetical protein